MSNQNWRLISAKKGKTSIKGKIRVERNATGSEGNFNSKSLLLDKKAISNSKPELEILEDEVICSHGSSVGEIDKAALFYLRSRGLSDLEATKLLLNGFVRNCIDETDVVRDLVISKFSEFLDEVIIR